MSLYLDRYAWPEPLFADPPVADVEMVVVVPCHNETGLITALYSLGQCTVPANSAVLVIINHAKNADPHIVMQNRLTAEAIDDLKAQYPIPLFWHICPLPPKHAGVGLARKIGMDEAVRWFEAQHRDGIIVCYDADCYCAPNYLNAIYQFYQQIHHEVGTVFFEHRLEAHAATIIQYECFLRYYVEGLQKAGYPFAIQTLGSCITIRSRRYQKEGGMNRRKAGEDFYFLHKVIQNGGYGEINNTTIFPSDRISDRVPFGTGHAIHRLLGQPVYRVYDPRSFECLQSLIEVIPNLYHQKSTPFEEPLAHFLKTQRFEEILSEIRRQSPSEKIFRQRFYRWLDGFRVLKLIHHLRDHYLPLVPLEQALHFTGLKGSLPEMLAEMVVRARTNSKQVI